MKKKVIPLLMIVMLLAPAFSYAANEEVAKMFAGIARVLMTSRQLGVPLVKAMAPIDKIDDEDVRAVVRQITIDAYKQPRFTSEEYQQRAITEFENKWYLIVLEAK